MRIISDIHNATTLGQLQKKTEMIQQQIQQAKLGIDSLMENNVRDYWNNVVLEFDQASNEEKAEFFKHLAISFSELLFFVQNLAANTSSMSSIVDILADMSSTMEDDVVRMYQELNEIWNLVDSHEREFTNLKNKTHSFAIIGGGKSNESNIPGRDKPNANTTGKSCEGIT